MKKASVRDLHLKTSAIIEEAAQGQVFVIEKRGTPVAELRPLQSLPTTSKLPDREKALAKFRPVKTDSGRILEEERS